MGDLNGSKTDYDKTLFLQDDFADAFLNRGVTNKMLGEYGLALSDFKTAVMLNPENPKMHNALGNIRVMFGDYNSAVRDFDKAIQLDVNFSSAFHNRGLAKILLHKTDEGCEDLQTALRMGYDKASELIAGFCEDRN